MADPEITDDCWAVITAKKDDGWLKIYVGQALGMSELDSRTYLVEQTECLFRIVFPKWGSFVKRTTCTLIRT